MKGIKFQIHVNSASLFVQIDYKFLGMLRAQFPHVPILWLTATAGEHVLSDCLQILRIPDALVFRASFNRPNLFYEVHARCSSYALHLSLSLGSHNIIVRSAGPTKAL